MATTDVKNKANLDLWTPGYSRETLSIAKKNRVHVLPRRGFYSFLSVVLMLSGIFLFCLAVLDAKREADSALVINAVVVDSIQEGSSCRIIVRYNEVNGFSGFGEIILPSCLALGETIEVHNKWDEKAKKSVLQPVDTLSFMHDYQTLIVAGTFVALAMFLMYRVISALRLALALTTTLNFHEIVTVIGILRKHGRRGCWLVKPVYLAADGRVLVDYQHMVGPNFTDFEKVLGQSTVIGINNGYFIKIGKLFCAAPALNQVVNQEVGVVAPLTELSPELHKATEEENSVELKASQELVFKAKQELSQTENQEEHN